METQPYFTAQEIFLWQNLYLWCAASTANYFQMVNHNVTVGNRVCSHRWFSAQGFWVHPSVSQPHFVSTQRLMMTIFNSVNQRINDKSDEWKLGLISTETVTHNNDKLSWILSDSDPTSVLNADKEHVWCSCKCNFPTQNELSSVDSGIHDHWSCDQSTRRRLWEAAKKLLTKKLSYRWISRNNSRVQMFGSINVWVINNDYFWQ